MSQARCERRPSPRRPPAPAPRDHPQRPFDTRSAPAFPQVDRDIGSAGSSPRDHSTSASRRESAQKSGSHRGQTNRATRYGQSNTAPRSASPEAPATRNPDSTTCGFGTAAQCSSVLPERNPAAEIPALLLTIRPATGELSFLATAEAQPATVRAQPPPQIPEPETASRRTGWPGELFAARHPERTPMFRFSSPSANRGS